MIRITAFTSPDLSVDNWTISSGDAWCVVGPNGSGKQFIDQLPKIPILYRKNKKMPDKVVNLYVKRKNE